MKTAATFLILVLAVVQLQLLLAEGHVVRTSLRHWEGKMTVKTTPTTSCYLVVVFYTARGVIERRGVSSCHKRQAADDSSTSCLLQPELTQGPYYWPNSTVRRNVTCALPPRCTAAPTIIR